MNSINKCYLVFIYSIRVPRPLVTVSTADIPVLHSAEVVVGYREKGYPKQEPKNDCLDFVKIETS